ncbi:MAG: LLM class flavin-dependent oxidoreductase [Armatimonadetes bacterium]|nr:LLM class flavin-dependent oxidoreductase [Armatimonadota bacterium]
MPVGLPLPELAEFLRRCEDAGFHGVGIHDHPHSGRDVYLALARAASRTTRLTLYPATSNPVSRHPVELATLAHSLEELAPGRVRLTVAPGFLAVRSIGRPRATVDVMRDAVVKIRRLLAGDAVQFGATSTRLRHTSARPTPVYMLAAGPRMVELAGEVADGVFLMVGFHPDSIAAARRHLAAGAHRGGRDPGAIPTIFVVTIALEEDVNAARRWPRRWFAPGQSFLTYPSRANLYWLRAAGIDLPDNHVPEEISDDLAARICDTFGVFGSPEYCARRLRQMQQEAGVQHVLLFPAHTKDGAYEMPEREVAAFRDAIRPRLRR